MTPEEKRTLDGHVQAIAKILYADADKSRMRNLGEIEAGIRSQLQEHVHPQIGVFYHNNDRDKSRIRPYLKKHPRNASLEPETGGSLRG
jgi:hypothetical protein